MKIAIVQVRRMADHYYFDTINALFAAELRRAGHRARIFDHNLAGAESEQAALVPLRRALDDFGAELILFDRVHRPDLAAELRPACALAVGGLLQPGVSGMEAIDFGIPLPDRDALLAAVAALERGGRVALRGIGGVETSEGSPPLPRPPTARRLFAGRELAYDLLEVLRRPPEPPPLRKHVLANLGCPYRLASNRTGFFDGVPLPDGVTARGCTFCDRPAYDPASVAETLDLIRHQLRQLRAAFPALEQLVLVDEGAFRYADRLTDLLAEEGAAPLDVLLSARIDHVLRHERTLAAALARAPAGLVLVAYLVGVESFSPFELLRFNKGLTVGELGRALALLSRFEAENAGSFRVEPTFGFIMFTPWTSPLDLHLNLLYLRRFRFDRLRQAAVLTRLRLYPNSALYHRALADGLLRPGQSAGADASARYGYEAETPWAFRDPRVGRIYEAVYRSRGGEQALRRLRWCLRPYLAEIRRQLDAIDFTDAEAIVRGARDGPDAACR